MPFRSLGGTVGYITVGTTAVRLSANFYTGVSNRTEASNISAHTIYIQQHPSNTGSIYLLDRAEGVILSGLGVLSVLPPPFSVDAALTACPWIAFTVPYAPGGLNASDYYLISDAGSQKVIASMLQV